MQHEITKLCADSLRAFLNANYGIKLKSGHAHEITAAVFGYKSRIALLADSSYPMSRLEQAEFILLVPDRQLIDQRLQCLEGLPVDLPSGDILIEAIYSVITDDPELSERVQPSFHELAKLLAGQPIHEKLRMLGLSPNDFKWKVNVESDQGVSEVAMTVSFDYLTDSGGRHRYGKVDVKLNRIAGNIGYGAPAVHPTFYAGKFHDPSYNPDFGLNSGRPS